MSREIQVTFDCGDPAALADFWAGVLGYVVQPPPEGFDSWERALEAWGVPAGQRNSRSALLDPESRGPRIYLQRVSEGKAAKNRVHLDVRAAPGLEGEARMTALEEESARLVAIGAVRLLRMEPGSWGSGHIVMQDPEGNEFCLD
jgi:catechol 2,3-dioxygenase-like lactoylglutathione lyase family enzyme